MIHHLSFLASAEKVRRRELPGRELLMRIWRERAPLTMSRRGRKCCWQSAEAGRKGQLACVRPSQPAAAKLQFLIFIRSRWSRSVLSVFQQPLAALAVFRQPCAHSVTDINMPRLF